MNIFNTLLVNSVTMKFVRFLDSKPTLWYKLRPIIEPIVSKITHSDKDSDERTYEKMYVITLGQL